MEQPLLAASLRSRQDYDLIREYIDLKLSTYNKLFQIVMAKVGEYYARDGTAQFVLPEVLLTQVAESLRNAKHVERIQELVSEALASTGSDVNVRAAILLAKQQEVGDRLSQAVSGASGGDVDALMAEYSQLRAMTNLDELTEQGLEVYHDLELEHLIAAEFDPTSLIKVYPSSFNDRLDGGAKRGHHIVVFARPEVGKSNLCINANCGFARQGFKSLYFINEDRPQDIILRHVSNLSGMNKRQIQADPKQAQALANANGFQNIIVVSCSPGTPTMIEEYCDKYQPDCVIIDQLRNLKVKAENRTNQLEYAASAARDIGKRCNVLMTSVTQAGDSARNKAVLDDGDVDFSNTGIPAQADLLVGMGMDAVLEAENRRVLNLIKNKISGRHENFPVNIIPQLSRMTSV